MIQSLKIKNFLSFRNEVTLSFEASNDKFAEEFQVVEMGDAAKTRLLRLGIIYGYNASGKSNMLKAFDFLNSFWSYSPNSPDEGIKISPFRLNDYSPKEHTLFELVFFSEGTKYVYQLELNSSVVFQEKLSYYKSTQPIMLFDRSIQDDQSEFVFNNQNGDKVSSILKEKITLECLKNMSFFVAREKANVKLPLIDKARNWIRNQFMPLISPQTDLTKEAQFLTYKNTQLVSYLLEFLHKADFNVTNIETELKLENVSAELANILSQGKSISRLEREKLLFDKTLVLPKTTFEHTVENELGKNSYDFSIEDESMGTLKTFGLGTSLYQALKNQAFLPVDEVENSLHPKLQERMIFNFLSTPSQSQLLLATHNDGLLDLISDLLRKDSIWFTEKDKAGVTDLYKLTDFRGINRLTSIREAYRNRRFGATIGYGK